MVEATPEQNKTEPKRLRVEIETFNFLPEHSKKF